MSSTIQENEAANGFCKVLNHRSKEDGVSGQGDLECRLLPENITEDRSPKRHHGRCTSAPNAERTFPNTTHCNEGDAPGQDEHSWGARAAHAGDMQCGDTKPTHSQKAQRHPLHTERPCGKIRGVAWVPGSGTRCLQLCWQHHSSPSGHGRRVKTKGLGQFLA